jgi:hypothetical protein
MPPSRLLAGLLVACCLLLSTDAAGAEAGSDPTPAPIASPAAIDPRLGEIAAMMPAELAGLSIDEHVQAATGEQIVGVMQPSEAARLDALLVTHGKSLDDYVAASTWLQFGESLALVLQAHRIVGVDASTTVDDWVGILSQHLSQPRAGSQTVAGRHLTTLADAAAPKLPPVYLLPDDDVLWMIWTGDEAMAETAVLTLTAEAAPEDAG